jgi:hypothetical protein
MPGKGFIRASDEASATLQTTLVIHEDIAPWIPRVKLSRADVHAILDLTHGLANGVIDDDVRLRIDLEDVQTKFSFDVHNNTPRSFAFLLSH